MENIELDVGGTKIKGIWIAIVLSFASTIGGGIWTASEFFSRLSAQEQAVQDAIQTASNIQEQFSLQKSLVNDQINLQKSAIEVMNQQLSDNDVSGLQGKLATLGTNLEAIMKRQSELLALNDKVASLETKVVETSVRTDTQLSTLENYDQDMKRMKREIEDLWNGMDALSNPLN